MNATLTHSRLRAWPCLLLMLALLLGAAWAPQPASAAPNPTLLEFNADAGGIEQTGFDSVLAGAIAANDNLTSVADGALVIQATSGDLPPYGSGQDSALALSYTSSGAYTIGARLLKPSFAGIQTSLDLFLTIDHQAKRISALYRIDSDLADAGRQATSRNFPRWPAQARLLPIR